MKGRRGRDRKVVGLTTTCVINAYHHYCCEFESHSWQGVLDTAVCDRKFVSDLRRILRFPPPIKLTARYS